MICHRTNKRRYPSRSEADRMRRYCEKNRPGKSLRVFPCSDCKGWHLTSLPLWKQISGSDAARRQVAEEQSREIALEETAYLWRRLSEVGEEVRAEMEQVLAEAFLAYIDRWKQKQILKELGLCSATSAEHPEVPDKKEGATLKALSSPFGFVAPKKEFGL